MKINTIPNEELLDCSSFTGKEIKSVIKSLNLKGLKKVVSRKKTTRQGVMHYVEISIEKPEVNTEKELHQIKRKLNSDISNAFVKANLNPTHINDTIEFV